MPWAWHLAQWCKDHTASALSGKVQFRLPYPQSNWRLEHEWNGFLVDAMTVSILAERIFTKDSEMWSRQEKDFYKWMVNGCLPDST